MLDRDGRPATARVLRFGLALALADGESPPSTGFLQERSGGPPQVVGAPFSEEASAALHRAEPGVGGQVPLDLDGALARVDPEAPEPSGSRLASGGVFVWPILAVGLLGLVVLAERFLFLVLRSPRPRLIRQVVRALGAGDPAAARAQVKAGATDLERVLLAGVEVHGRPLLEREQAVETALLREEPTLERGIALLGAVAGLAPLLGLLGTVTGMIETFDVISTFGTGNPKLLSGGISVALVTTQLGLVVAVPAILAHAWVSRAVAKRQALLEEARTALLALPEKDAPRGVGGPGGPE